jgi:methylation protein EvaC
MTHGERVGKLVGEHRHHDRCRFCFSTEMVPFVDFGYVPLAGGFHPKGSTQDDLLNERVYPLQICFCKKCSLVQVNNAISGEILFKDHYYYLSSAIKTLADHFQRYAQDLREAFPNPSSVTFLELGCNDGVFLRPLRVAGFNVIGVDPAGNVVKSLIDDGFTIVNDFFTASVADRLKRQHGQIDAIFSSNSFAHIDDMHDVMKGVQTLLKPDGYLAFEVHYLGTLIEEMHYDMIYHEHLSYYSLKAIQSFLAGP